MQNEHLSLLVNKRFAGWKMVDYTLNTHLYILVYLAFSEITGNYVILTGCPLVTGIWGDREWQGIELFHKRYKFSPQQAHMLQNETLSHCKIKRIKFLVQSWDITSEQSLPVRLFHTKIIVPLSSISPLDLQRMLIVKYFRDHIHRSALMSS